MEMCICVREEALPCAFLDAEHRGTFGLGTPRAWPSFVVASDAFRFPRIEKTFVKDGGDEEDAFMSLGSFCCCSAVASHGNPGGLVGGLEGGSRVSFSVPAGETARGGVDGAVMLSDDIGGCRRNLVIVMAERMCVGLQSVAEDRRVRENAYLELK